MLNVAQWGVPFSARLSPVLAAAGSSSGYAAQDKRRVLIVEDDFIVASELEHHLEMAGFDVVGAAATAAEAIAMAQAGKPLFAVMDVRLAGDRDGVDTAVVLFRDFGIRSIFATAHTDAATMARASAAAPLGWLQKPYSPASLVAAINAALPSG